MAPLGAGLGSDPGVQQMPGSVGRLTGAVRLIHPFPVAVVVITSAALLELAHHGGLGLPVLLRACAAVLCSQVAVGAYNDYVDRFSDALVQPGKPIPSGAASPATARILIAAGLVGAVLLSFTFGPVSLVLVLAGTGAGLAYDRWLKRSPLSVAGYIAGFLLLITWIWYVAGRLTPGFLILYPAGTLLVSAAHLAQSLPDVETDRVVGARGFAVALGVERSVLAIVAAYALLATGAVIIAFRSGAPLLILGPLAGMVVVAATALQLRENNYAKESRAGAFHAFGPALALLAVSAAIACIRLGIL